VSYRLICFCLGKECHVSARVICPLLFSIAETTGDGDVVEKIAALLREERAEQQRLVKEERAEQQRLVKEEREQELSNRLVRVTLRMWEGGREVVLFAKPSSVYQQAGDAFSQTPGRFTLYVLADAKDFSTRMKLDSESPVQTALVLLVSPPPVVLVYARPPNDSSPARPPAPLPESKDIGGVQGHGSSESSGSRGQQQAEFRMEVMSAAKWRDYLTGESIRQIAGEDGQPGEACHIIPVAKGPFGTLETRRALLKKLGQQPNLYITANGIPLLTDFHTYFDSFELSINADKEYEICVWNVPSSATKVHKLKGKPAALKKTPWIACKPLLKWHHQKCIDKHPAQQVLKGEG